MKTKDFQISKSLEEWIPIAKGLNTLFALAVPDIAEGSAKYEANGLAFLANFMQDLNDKMLCELADEIKEVCP